MQDLPIGKYNTAVEFGPGRRPDLPTIYKTPSHPKRQGPGNIYYYLQDLSKPALKKAHELEMKMQIPHGPKSLALERGFLELQEDDIIFVRGTMAPATGEKDVAVCWVNGGRIYTENMKNELLAARDQCLGAEHLRSRSAPSKVNGQWTGGTAFERNARANPVKPNTRCYSIGNSFESQTQIMAPCKDNKIKGNQDAEAIKMRSDLVKASSAMSMKAMEAGPSEVLEHVKINAELINTPSLGHENNIAFTAMQLNIAPAQPCNSEDTLSGSMGSFGGEHLDSKDNPGLLTTMTVVSALPLEYNFGRFFILFPAVFATLVNYATITFSGLRYHGGTAPYAPDGSDIDAFEAAVRFAVINYPPSGQTKGDQRYALGGLPNNTTFYISKEMTATTPLVWEDRGWCSHATYLEDGHTISAQQGHVQFIVRALYLLVLYFLLQLPEAYGVKIDLDQFFAAFSMMNDANQRVRVGTWPLAPGYRRRNSINGSLSTSGTANTSRAAGNSSTEEDVLMADPTASEAFTDNLLDDADFIDQDKVRSVKRAKWESYYRHVACHIPYAVCKTNGEPPWCADNIGIEPGNVAADAVDNTNISNEEDATMASKPIQPVNSRGGRPEGRTIKTAARPTKRPRVEEDDASGGPEPSTRCWPDAKALIDLLARTQSPDVDASTNIPQTRSSKAKHAAGTSFRMDIDWDENLIVGQAANAVGGQWREDEPSSIPRNSDLDAVFLHNLSLDDIKSEYDAVSDDVFSTLAHGNGCDKLRGIALLQGLHDAITHDSLSSASLPHILNGWIGVQALENLERTSGLEMRKQRSSIMITNYLAWYWLDVYIVDHCKRILKNPTAYHNGWLVNLVNDVKEHCMLRRSPRLFKASSYGLDLPHASHLLDIGANARMPTEMEKRTLRMTSIVVNIIERWLGYPTEQRSRRQAWFIHVIVTEFGPNTLLLDRIWAMHSDLKRQLFATGSWRLDSFKVIRPLREAVAKHPLHNPSSGERKMVDEIALLTNGFFDGSLTIEAYKSADQRIPSQTTPLLRDRLSPSLRQVADQEMALFATFLQDCLTTHLNLTTVPVSHPRLSTRIQENPDKYLPFREFAPSRMRICGPGGPFTPEVARTTKGILSALIWRGITFGTQFAATGPMIFPSADAFDQARAAMGSQPEEYFCDKSAYGVCNPGRKPALAQSYWNSLKNGQWLTFAGNRTIPFLECYRFFLAGKAPPIFPQIGPLTSYLLTADLSYSGIVQIPSFEDIVLIIHEINRGAVSALERLRLITPRLSKKRSKAKCNRNELGKALQFMQKAVDDIIVPAQRMDLKVDLIMLEHALCKFSRASEKKLLVQ